MKLEKIKRQLRAILAKAQEGSGTTEEEAMNALGFARRLMLRHQLTTADLSKERDRTPHEVAADTEYNTVRTYTEGRCLSHWQSRLAEAVAQLVGTVRWYYESPEARRSNSGCLVFDGKGKPKQATPVIYYGPAEDCRDASELFDEWVITIAALARMKFGGALRGPGRSYAEGFADTLLRRVMDMRARERDLVKQGGCPEINLTDAALCAANEADADACTTLVVAGARELMQAKRDRAEAWLRDVQGIRLSSGGGGGGGGRQDAGAYGAGQRDGRAASFNRTVTRKLS